MAMKKDKKKSSKSEGKNGKVAGYKKLRREQKAATQAQMTATAGVIDAARDLAQKIFKERTEGASIDLVLKPGDELIRALFVALDAYDGDETYVPFNPPEIQEEAAA
jgi:hypothetical protein